MNKPKINAPYRSYRWLVRVHSAFSTFLSTTRHIGFRSLIELGTDFALKKINEGHCSIFNLSNYSWRKTKSETWDTEPHKIMKSCLEVIWLNQWRAQAMVVKAKLNDWTIGLKDEQRVVEGLTPWQSWARTWTWAANDRQPGHGCECIISLSFE